MSMSSGKYYAALDIGAGRGVKIAYFTPGGEIASETLLGLEDYCPDFEDFAGRLALRIRESLPPRGKLLAMGISSAGILSSDGGFQLFANCA